ncbi:MAG TPA: DUF4339 domain-containing protein [Rhizomicrobium sp.]|nr:DUF4339 domain-containing protein [Rhizomicrobium sp.]
MAESWNISVGGRSYGPYSFSQMQAFVAEGRLAAHSQVAPEGSADFHPAGDDTQLGALFAPAKKSEPIPSATGQFLTARKNGSDDVIANTFGRGSRDERGTEHGRYLILADMKSKSISGLEEEILNLGPAYSLMPQVWILVSDQTVNGVRNALVPKLGKIDTLFIVDATHNKATWFNFGPETDARIRRVWMAHQAEPTKAGAR